jgi:hypothetical protein
MLNRSTLHTFPNFLLHFVRNVTAPVALKRAKPLCAILLCSVLLLSVGLGAPAARPQLLTRVLDDFTTGHLDHPITLSAGNQREFQQGAMAGGFRTILFGVNSLLGQTGTLDIRPGDSEHGYLIVGTGYKAFHGLEVVYGQDLQGRPNPLNLNLCLYDRFRVHFEALTGGTNFNIVVYTNNGRGRAQLGFNIPPNGAPFAKDFPFADFVAAQPLPEMPNWADVDFIVLEPNTGGSGVGGNDFAITSFTAVCGNPLSCVSTCLR